MKEKEHQSIEWKESWQDEYLKWICGYANAYGGREIRLYGKMAEINYTKSNQVIAVISVIIAILAIICA